MNKKRKILFVQEKFGNISEVFLYRLITGINVFDVEVLTENYINRNHFPFDINALTLWKDPVVPNFKKIIPFIRKKLKLKGSYSSKSKQIIEIINNSDADLICFQFGFLPVMMGSDFEKIRKKTCIIHHGTDVNKAVEDKLYYKRLLPIWEKTDKIIFSSYFLMKTAHDLGCSTVKSVVNYIGVPTLSLEKYLPRANMPFRFICVARMVPVKNHITLIKAFSQLIKETNRSIELVLVGSGELEAYISHTIDVLKINKDIRLTGALNSQDTLLEIAKSDCSILVSAPYVVPNVMRQEEALGLSLIEGGGMGLPMIGSKSGGIPEIVLDGITGYLVEPLDSLQLKEAMLKILLDPEKSKEMGKNAAQLVQKKFDLLKQNKKFENIFMDIIS